MSTADNLVEITSEMDDVITSIFEKYGFMNGYDFIYFSDKKSYDFVYKKEIADVYIAGKSNIPIYWVQSYRDNNIYYYIGVEKEILEKLRSYL